VRATFGVDLTFDLGPRMGDGGGVESNDSEGDSESTRGNANASVTTTSKENSNRLRDIKRAVQQITKQVGNIKRLGKDRDNLLVVFVDENGLQTVRSSGIFEEFTGDRGPDGLQSLVRKLASTKRDQKKVEKMGIDSFQKVFQDGTTRSHPDPTPQ